MIPKQKADELFDKYYRLFNNFPNYQYVLENLNTIHDEKLSTAKQCALIAVDEILELKETQEEYQIQYDNGEWSREIGYRYSKYWQEVKQEIEKL